MANKITAALSGAADWLITLIWKKEENKLAIDLSNLIEINGKPIKVADAKAVLDALWAIYQGKKVGKTSEQIEHEIAPMLLTVAEDAASIILPGFGGPAVALVAFVIENEIPFWDLPQSEQNRIQDMAGSHEGELGS